MTTPAAAPPDTADLAAYVRAGAQALGIPMDDARVARVTENFARTAAMAALLMAEPMTPEDELAEIYRPAPFPSGDDA